MDNKLNKSLANDVNKAFKIRPFMKACHKMTSRVYHFMVGKVSLARVNFVLGFQMVSDFLGQVVVWFFPLMEIFPLLFVLTFSVDVILWVGEITRDRNTYRIFIKTVYISCHLLTFKLTRTTSFLEADEYSLHRIQNYYPTLIVQAHKLKTICVENYRVHVSKSTEKSRLKAKKLMARVQQSNQGKIWEISNEDARPVVTVQIQDNSSKDWNNQKIGAPKMSYPEGLVNNISEKIEKSK